MNALRNVVLGTLALIAVLIGIGLSLPDRARIERSVLIMAPATEVFEVLNGFARIDAWSPWTAIDPKMQFTREGPAQGLGARLRWFSEHPSVGSGKQEIVESEPDRRVRLRIDYTGFDGDNQSTFTLTPEAEGTRVVWLYETGFKGNLIGRYVGLMLEGRVGAYYEKGLLNLKLLVEGDRRGAVAPAP
jgi:uncharacterized protein YndB with AHSA1/START domain